MNSSRFYLLGHSEAQRQTHLKIEELLDQQPRLTEKEQQFVFDLRGRFRMGKLGLSVRQEAWLVALHKKYCAASQSQTFDHPDWPPDEMAALRAEIEEYKATTTKTTTTRTRSSSMSKRKEGK